MPKENSALKMLTHFEAETFRACCTALDFRYLTVLELSDVEPFRSAGQRAATTDGPKPDEASINEG